MSSDGTWRDDPEEAAAYWFDVIPHPGQIEWLRSHAKTKVACCGRRWGKSFSVAIDLIHFAICNKGTTQFLIAPTHDQSTIIFRYVENLLRDGKVAFMVDHVVYSPFPEIRLINGSLIRARSASNDAKNIRGHEADRIVIDEAAYVPDIVYETVTPLLATSRFGELLLISTPFGKNTFFDYWNRGASGDPDVISFRFPSETNPHISRSYLAQQKQDMTSLAYAVEYEAEFRDDQNSVFPTSQIQAAIRDDIVTEPQSGHRTVIGFDPAKFHDRSAVVVLDVTSQPWQVVRCLDIGGKEYLAQAAQLVSLSAEFGRAPILLDATSHDQMLEQLRKDGVKAEGLKFTNEVKGEIINGLAIALERGQIVIPRHPDLIREMTYYRAELTPAGNVKLGAPDKAGHYDDLVTALALAVHKASKHRAIGSLTILSVDRVSPWSV